MSAFFLSPIIQRVLESLPRDTAEIFETCLDNSASIEADPQGSVLAHQEHLRAASRSNEFLDLTQAEELTKRSLALLGLLGPDTLDAHRKLILAAVYYFILDKDAESDSDSILGLEDDEQVIAAVERVVTDNE
jgi:hypothetical protein